MRFSINYSSRSKKFLKNADKTLAKRIIGKIEKLSEDPIIPDTKTVECSKGLFRVSVGDYRILYEIDYGNNLLGIIKIDKRPRVYD